MGRPGLQNILPPSPTQGFRNPVGLIFKHPWDAQQHPTSFYQRSLAYLRLFYLLLTFVYVFFPFVWPRNLPGTSKINEKPLFFQCFSLFAHITEDSNKLSKNASKRLPGSLQDSPNPFQDLPKTPKMAPRHLQDAPLTPLGAPKTHARYTQDTPRVSQATQTPQIYLPGPIQSPIFERLEVKNYDVTLIFLSSPTI